MTTGAEARASVAPLEAGVRQLVRIAGAIAGSPEGQMRSTMSDAIDEVDPVAVEEIILQSYLFAGFPRALNAARAWRSVSGRQAPSEDPEASADLNLWRERGEETCEIVYGDSYEKLRKNIRDLHPALDEWMIVDGYGKVLSRPGVRCLGTAAAATLTPSWRSQRWLLARRARSGSRRSHRSHLEG